MTPALPISIYYFTFLGALGIFWPYFALYLSSVGLSQTEVTSVLALSPIMGFLAPPAFGLLADARRARGWLLRLASFGTALSFSGLIVAGNARVPLYLATAGFAFCRAPLLSLTDATAFEHVRLHGSNYGRMRVWGSVGFVVAVLVGGRLLDRVGLIGVLPATTFVLALAAAAAWWMPAPPPERHPEALAAWLRLLQRPDLWIFLIAVFFAQMAHAAYDSGFSLHLKRLGFSPSLVGYAWAIGVMGEVVLMLFAQRLFSRFGPERLFAVALGVGCLRWLLLAWVRQPALLLALQPLHGITFGWFYVSGVTIMRDRGGLEAPTAAQGLFAGAFALGSVVGMLSAGRILDAAGGRTLYSCAAAVAAVATICALGFARRRSPPRATMMERA